MKRSCTGRFAAGLCAMLLFTSAAPAAAAAYTARGDDVRSLAVHHVRHRARPASYGEPFLGDFAEEMLAYVNRERRKRGLEPLRISRKLMEAAATRAEEITQTFSHTRPNGEPCHSLIENGEYTMGENIAAGMGSPGEAVAQWMESPGHRANILNEDYTEMGVGYVYWEGSEYVHYWVQIFWRPMSKAIRRS